jgi:hypothetical protein
MARWEFIVPGPLVGHKCSVRAAHDVAVSSYRKHVRYLANLAGVPLDLDPDGTYRVTTQVFWKQKARTDTENVHKLTQDSVFKKDRRVLEVAAKAVEHAGKEEVWVLIERVA